MNTPFKVLAMALGALLSFSTVHAQVGINNSQPDSSSVLDLSGSENRTSGLLIPQVRADSVGFDGKELVKTPTAHGLLVFDPKDNEFYFWEDGTEEWYSLNRWKARNGNDTINTDNYVNTTRKIQENGNDLLPYGSIIMWHGATAPDGWVLCDGSAKSNSLGAPNLSDRFIVGAGNNYNVSNTGGANTVMLTGDQSGIQGHYHSFSGTTDLSAAILAPETYIESGSGYGNPNNGTAPVLRGDNASHPTIQPHTHTISGNTGITSGNATQAHENRPPYYALAFIMKL